MWLLVLTFAVATFHLLMDLLAFKNDIAFWHGTKSLRGLSLTALFVDLLCQIVIGLYLAEEDASALVLGPMAVSCVIQMWKVRMRTPQRRRRGESERADDLWAATRGRRVRAAPTPMSALRARYERDMSA